MESHKNQIRIAIHGGAGALSPEKYTQNERREHRQVLKAALSCGFRLYQQEATAVEIVVECVKVLEDSPLFNAGRGSVFSSNKEIEMDASIMCGHTRRVGGASLLKTVRHPILLANEVLQNSPHSLLAGPGAENFAKERGLKFEPPEYFQTEKRWQQLQAAKRKTRMQLDHGDTVGTVGAVARDWQNHLAAATSTGGMTNKSPGRVSDSSIVGAGTYADDRTCAVSGTGTGDQFIQNVTAFDLHARVLYGNANLNEGVSDVLEQLKQSGGSGGLIALNTQGHAILDFNTLGMFRGVINDEGDCEVAIHSQ